MRAWLLDTLGAYARSLTGGARLLVGNPILVVPAFACLAVPLLLAFLLLPLLGVAGNVAALVVGVLSVLLESACWSALLASTGEVIRTRRLVLADVRAGFLAYLGDVINVRFVLWLLTMVAGLLGGPIAVMVGLATLVFFNAVPELIYLGRYGTAELLAASYQFIGERWIEWFPLNVLLLVLILATSGTVLVAAGPVPGLVAWALGGAVTAVLLAFAMLVRGLLFLELTQSSRRGRAFRRAAGG